MLRLTFLLRPKTITLLDLGEASKPPTFSFFLTQFSVFSFFSDFFLHLVKGFHAEKFSEALEAIFNGASDHTDCEYKADYHANCQKWIANERGKFF